MNEPDKLLLRRKDVMTWMGISKWEFYQLIEAKILRPIRLRKHARQYFLKEEVKRIFLTTQIK